MYFSAQTIANSIERLKSVHPFFGITFFACKRNNLPVGKAIAFSMDNYTKNFMTDIHKIVEKSTYYFQPYKSNDRTKEWVDSRYPSTGLQAINTQTFSSVFIHTKGSSLWGWEENYVDVLKSKLNDNLLPTLELAIWFFKYEDWQSDVTVDDILEKFSMFFNITDDETKKLFLLPGMELLTGIERLKKTDFQDEPVTWDQLSKLVSVPPDAEPPHGARLVSIETKNIGPIEHLTMEANERLNLITGDNGLGKTFLMDFCWWVLTNSWAGMPITPNLNLEQNNQSVAFEIEGDKGKPLSDFAIFDRKKSAWQRNYDLIITGLFIYARADGSYAIWDPLKQNQGMKKMVLSKENIWDGVQDCTEGLVRDWVNWQRIDKEEFKLLQNLLKKMSPPDLGCLETGSIVRIPGGEIREIPTIKHRYGSIPIIYASAGVQRILTLAYLIVWTWYGHKIQAKWQDAIQETKMVILIDEIEAHLHPKWQRVILPSLLEIQSELSKQTEIQFVVSTHSPLILTSLEKHFDSDLDRLFKIDIEEKTNRVSMSEIDFIKYGTINSWLVSPVFDLGQARSKEAEDAINKAKKLQLQENPDKESVRSIHNSLLQVLSQDDSFWPRWNYWAEKRGIEI